MELDDLSSVLCPAQNSSATLGEPVRHLGLSLNEEIIMPLSPIYHGDHKVKFSLLTTLGHPKF